MQQHPHEHLDQLIQFGFEWVCEYCSEHYSNGKIQVNPEDYDKGDEFSKYFGCENCNNENIIPAIKYR
jgi:hypothetical protein